MTPHAARHPAPRGFVVTYRPGVRCPGCNGAGWHIGRTLAECATPRCGTALAFAGEGRT